MGFLDWIFGRKNEIADTRGAAEYRPTNKPENISQSQKTPAAEPLNILRKISQDDRLPLQATTDEEMIFYGSKNIDKAAIAYATDAMQAKMELEVGISNGQLSPNSPHALELQHKYNEADAARCYLLKMKKQAEMKPLLPKLRPGGYLKIGDEVFVFSDFDSDPFLIKGVVVAEMEDQDRVVAQVETMLDEDGVNEIAIIRNSPEIMLVWECEYLQAHPDYRKLWLDETARGWFPSFSAEQFDITMRRQMSSLYNGKGTLLAQ